MQEPNTQSHRVAVLISGQIRSSDGDLREMAKACEAVDADVFITVWRKRGAKGFGGGQGPQQLERVFGGKLALVMPRNWFGANIRKVFPNEQIIFPDSGAVDEARLHEIFPKAYIQVIEERPDLILPYMDSNSLRMLFMIDKCNRMKRSREAKFDFRYDTVIRHRPDVKLDYPKAIMHKKQIGKAVFPMSKQSEIKQLHDIYWVASSDEDDALTGLYNRANETRAEGWQGIHQELWQWVASRDISFEMFNCMISGIQEASFSNSTYQATVAQNFVTAVNTRQIDVEHAGGEDVCAALTHVLNALLNGENPPADTLQNQYRAIEAGVSKPRLALFLLQSQGWLLCADKSRSATDRISSFILTLSIDYLTRHEATAESCVGFLPELFQKDISVAEVVLCLSDEKYTVEHLDPQNTEFYEWMKKVSGQGDEKLADSVQAVAKGIFNDNRNSAWISERLKTEGCIEKTVPFVDAMLKVGVYSRGPVNQAAEQCRRAGDLTRMIQIAERGAEIDQSSHAYGVLGRYHKIANNPKKARAAFLKAQTFSDCAEWVNVALRELGEV